MIETALAVVALFACGVWIGAAAEGERVRREYCDKVSVVITSVDGEDDVGVGVRVIYHVAGKVAARDIEMKTGVHLDLVTRITQ